MGDRDKFVLGVKPAGELEDAFRRGGWINEEVKILSSGTLLSHQVRGVVQKTHQIVPVLSSIATLDKTIVPATAIDFQPDMFPGGKVGAALQFGMDRSSKLEDLLAPRNPNKIGSVTSNLLVEKNFPTRAMGRFLVNAYAVNCGKYMTNAELDRVPQQIMETTGRSLLFAEAKEEVQLLQAAPRPMLDGCYPLAARGNFFAGAGDGRCFLPRARRGAVRRQHLGRPAARLARLLVVPPRRVSPVAGRLVAWAFLWIPGSLIPWTPACFGRGGISLQNFLIQ